MATKRRTPPRPKPPKAYERFVDRFPDVARAWDALGAAGRSAGPLDEHVSRLVKLAIAVGAQREGAVRAATRHALSSGVSREAIEQTAALAASTVGVPAAVAAWTWMLDALDS